MSKKIGNLNVVAGYRYVEACNWLKIKGKEKGGTERIRRVYGDTIELPLRDSQNHDFNKIFKIDKINN
jgi:hypothetical protein